MNDARPSLHELLSNIRDCLYNVGLLYQSSLNACQTMLHISYPKAETRYTSTQHSLAAKI